MGDRLPKWIARRLRSSSRVTTALRPVVNRLVPERPTVVTVVSGRAAGLRLEILPRSEKYYWLGTYEPEVLDALCAALRPGSVFWDVGAHVGYLSAVASRLVGPTGEIVAFEPNPSNLGRLRRTIELNGLENVRVRPVAISDGPAELRFLLHASSSMGHVADPAQDGETIVVEASSLDHEAATSRTPDLVKIDVEGHEPSVIAGAAELCRNRPPTLVIEVLSEQHRHGVVAMPPGFSFRMLDRTNMLAIPPAVGDGRRTRLDGGLGR